MKVFVTGVAGQLGHDVMNELAKRGFRDSRMFLDTRSLTSGNYLKTILDAIAGSRNIVVIVTKDCFKNLPTDSTWVR